MCESGTRTTQHIKDVVRDKKTPEGVTNVPKIGIGGK